MKKNGGRKSPFGWSDLPDICRLEHPACHPSFFLSLERRVALNGAPDAMSDADLNTIVDQRQVSVPNTGADEDVRCINKVMQVSTKSFFK